jgi:putative copper resistance protein D
MSPSLNPVVLLYLAGALLLYRRAIVILARRGRTVPAWQQAAFYGGIALTAMALIWPVDPLGDDLLTMHMAQHLLLADLAAPLLIAGVRHPVLMFMLPRPVLVPLARNRPLRRLLAVLTRPWVALPVFVVLLYGWHFQGLFEAAAQHGFVHALQHMGFFLGSLLVWWPVLEPARRRMPGGLWKIGHIFAARLISAMLGMGMIFSHSPWYPDVYDGRADISLGLSPLADQQTAGGIMMTLDVIVIAFALTLFFWRSASDYEREQAGAATAVAR